MNEKRIENLIIIGGGPAGYTAALYAARAELEPLVIEGFRWGGQLQNTTDVENYPGYLEGVMGPEMMNEFRAQAERFGTRFITDDVTEVELTDGGIQTVKVGKDTYQAKAVILSMGAEPKRLGIPGEMELQGRGVSTCGVCDGAFFKGEDVAVIGGGDSAMEDSIFVSKFADKLTSVHRRDDYRASKIMQERARSKDNIEFLTPYVPKEFVAGDDGKIAKIALENAETGEQKELEVGGGIRRDRPQASLRAGQGSGGPRRRGLRRRRGALDQDQPQGCLRGRRPGRQHLPAGGDRRRVRHQGCARRRVVPPRHAPRSRGALGYPDRRDHRRRRRRLPLAPSASACACRRPFPLCCKALSRQPPKASPAPNRRSTSAGR